MFPLEIFTMLGGTVVSAIFRLLAKHLEIKSLQNEFLLKSAGLNMKDRQDARSIKDPGVQWTRRTIALLTVISVIVLPKVVLFFGMDTGVTYLYTEENGLLLSFFSGSNELKGFHSNGVIITPIDTHMVAAIAGLYFGGSVVGR